VENMKTFTNRYKDVYTFTLDLEGNILWEGNFKYCRFGRPNDYTKSYKQYLDDNCNNDKCLSLEEFKNLLHETFHDQYNPMLKYAMLIKSDTTKIDMVDPSGGPYITVGSDMGMFDEEFKGLKVVDFEIIDTGYKLITNKNK